MPWALLALCAVLSFADGAGAAEGTRVMVASEHRLASEAGLRILRQGGNAVDAAVATALAVGVVNPTSCGIGGGGFMLVFDRRTSSVEALDYRETAPAAARRDMFVADGKVIPGASVRGGLAVAVPGEVAGLLEALRRFGTRSWREVAAPAIEYARDGFAIEHHLADAIAANRDEIAHRPALAALLLRADGTPLGEGERLRQSDLAVTFERVSEIGRAAVYEGPVADAIERSVGAAEGILRAADLARYRPVHRSPVSGALGAYRVWSMPPPSSGGGVLLQILRTVGADDLRALEHNSPTYVHLLHEAMAFGFADRATYYGDSDFVRVPLTALLRPARALRLRRTLSAATTFSPAFYGEKFLGADHGTSHLSVIDAEGNAVACTTSINTAFGSMVVAEGTGILLNNTMDDFSVQPGVANVYGLVGSEANSIAPGKRPLSSMTPTIVTSGGEAVAALGGSGGPFIITATLQVLLNSLVFGLDAEHAVAAPRLHHQWLPSVLMLEPPMPQDTAWALRRLGHRVVEARGIGSVALVRRRPDGRLDGAGDPRKGGYAAGW